MKIGQKVVILFGRCVNKVKKKHAARTPVGEGGKEGGSEKNRKEAKWSQKYAFCAGGVEKRQKKTCSENARRGGREGGLGSARPAPSSTQAGCQAASAREPRKSPR